MTARTEEDTRADLVDKFLREAGWDNSIRDVTVLRAHTFTDGKIAVDGSRGKRMEADYLLKYRNVKLAVIEAKKETLSELEGVAQAEKYAQVLNTPFAYATNGKRIYEIPLHNNYTESNNKLKRKHINTFPSPQELWDKVFGARPESLEGKDEQTQEWENKVSFHTLPYPLVRDYTPRYYQEAAVDETMNAIARGQKRILLNLATGTGKTDIAFHICWKLYQSRWSLTKKSKRLPRILFLSDRNILTDQALQRFGNFPADELIRVTPDSIKKRGSELPKNGTVFFSIFQTLMGGKKKNTKYQDWERNFFDLVIIDECHRGGANDESNWRTLLEYFSPAVQIGLTATPKVKTQENINTYEYFGEPVYTYSLKQGIEDGFLTPFKVLNVSSNIDDYTYMGDDDDVEEGEVEVGETFIEKDFNVKIEIRAREEHRIKVLLANIRPNDKTIIFCQTIGHAALIKELVINNSQSQEPNYCARVTAADGEDGDNFLRQFQDNEKTIPTILTTSKKLSTGVDVRNLRNIVMMRNVNSMVEFKQILGRGTRVCENKNFFTIIDFCNATERFEDPDWDGPPIEVENKNLKNEIIEKEDNPIPPIPPPPPDPPNPPKTMIRIKLSDGKERNLHSKIERQIYFDNRPIKPLQLVEELCREMTSNICRTEEELHGLWSNNNSRLEFLVDLAKKGYSEELLKELNEIIANGRESDLYDLLKYVAFGTPDSPLSKAERVDIQKEDILNIMDNEEKKIFARFILNSFVAEGSNVFNNHKMKRIIQNKYGSLADARSRLGDINTVIQLFSIIQKKLFT